MPWSYNVVKEKAGVFLQGFHEVELKNDFGRPRELQPTDGDGELLAHLEEARQQVLDRARQEAEALLVAARAEQEAIREQARQEGWEQGYREALEAAGAQAEQIREQARQVLQQSWEERARIIQESEAEMVALALDIAEKVVHAHLAVAPETVGEVARAAVRQACRSQNFIIFVHPRDADFLRRQVDKLLEEVDPQSKIQVIADSALTAGGCRIETENVTVDATIEGELAELREALRAAREAKNPA